MTVGNAILFRYHNDGERLEFTRRPRRETERTAPALKTDPDGNRPWLLSRIRDRERERDMGLGR